MKEKPHRTWAASASQQEMELIYAANNEFIVQQVDASETAKVTQSKSTRIAGSKIEDHLHTRGNTQN